MKEKKTRPREETLPKQLLNLKEKTSWSWERLSREFQRVMGEAGPSMTTLLRYASGNVKRRNLMMERYVREAIHKVTVQLMQKELRKSEEQREYLATELHETEVHFHQLVENARDVIYRYRVAPPRGYEYISPVIQDILGYTSEEFYANHNLLLKIVHPDDRTRLEQEHQGKGPFHERATLRCLHRDGSMLWIERLNVPIYDEAGNLVAVEGIARDITEHKEAEAKAARLAAIVTSSNDAIISSRSDGSIVSWNAAAERLFGYPAEEVIGQGVSILHPAEKPGQYFEMFERLVKGEPLEYTNMVLVRKDGKRIHVSLSISPMTDNEGQINGFSTIVREITGRKQLDEET